MPYEVGKIDCLNRLSVSKYDQLCSGTLFSLFSSLLYTTCQKVFSSFKMKNLFHEKLDRLQRINEHAGRDCYRVKSLWFVFAALRPKLINYSINRSIKWSYYQGRTSAALPKWKAELNHVVKTTAIRSRQTALRIPVRITVITFENDTFELKSSHVTGSCERTDCM